MRVIRAEDRSYVPASHEDPTKPGVLKKVLATKDEIIDGKVQMINWAKLPVGTSFRLHYHEDMEETFIMIRGKARMRIADNTFELSKGDTAVVAPRELHEMLNSGEEDVEYIVIGVSTGENGKTVVVDANHD